MEDNKEYLSIEQTAKKLGISPGTVRNAIKAGELETYRAGRQHRITQEQIDAWIKPGAERV